MQKLFRMTLHKINIIFLHILSTAVYSQQKDSTSTSLSEVMISATRTERQLASVPLPVQVISKAQIKQSGALRLNDILEEQTGLIIVPDFGGVLGIQMQGLDAQYTLILIDGVPLVGRSAGTMDLSRITVNNIKQIEIVKGASSSLYGSEALGGVINIITETPESNKFNGNLNSRIGTKITIDNNVNIGFGIKKLKISAALNSFSTNGYDLDKSTPTATANAFKNYTSNLQLSYKWSDKVKLLLSNRYFFQESPFNLHFGNRTYSGLSTINEYNVHSRLFFNPSSDLSFVGEMYSSQFYTKEAAFFTDNKEPFYNDFFKENLQRPEIRSTYKKRNTTYTAGLGYNFNNLERTLFSSKAFNNSYFSFLQYDYNIDKKWNVLAGLRYDKNMAFASVLSPKLALSFNLNPQFSIQTSVGKGFKAPDLRQLFLDFENPAVGYIVLGFNVAPNKLASLQEQGRIASKNYVDTFFTNALQPESSTNFNFGIKHQIQKLKTSINVFHNRVVNQIETIGIARLTNNQSIFSYKNVASVFTQGFECNAVLKINNTIEISGGYQYLIAKDNEVIQNLKDKKIFARDPITLQSFELQQSDYFGLFNRSKHTANFKYFLKIPTWNITHNFRATYRSKYGLFDTNSNQILDNYDEFAKEYVIFDTSITKTFYKKLEIQAGIDNVLNFTDPQNAINFAGRLLYCKVQCNF